MKASALYRQLDADFLLPGITDDWFSRMPALAPYICEGYQRQSMGLVCDFAEEIEKVYTAVFPSARVLDALLAGGATNALLFVHHPMDWDFTAVAEGASGSGFYPMRSEQLNRLRENRISIYNLHHPLDNFGEYATSKTLADALGMEIVEPFARICGADCGVIARTRCADIRALHALFSETLGLETTLYAYGGEAIKDGRVGVCAGGGNQLDIVQEMLALHADVLVTGITLRNDYSASTHAFERENGIRVLGGTHYATEKFACMAMCDYFAKLGLDAAFIPDIPCLADM